MKSLAALTLALAGVFVTPFATAQALPNVPGDGGPLLTAVKEINGIAFLNGGADIDDANYLKSRSSEFALQFIFSGRGGEYGVADRVTIRRGGVELISVADAGPLLMLKLPPGSYSVEATFKGSVETRSVAVGKGISKVNWNTLRASD
jgi:hypothetical protein